MTLLDHYVRAVGIYLPRGNRDDILSELAEHLQTKLEEREAELGRPVTEAEQQEVLAGHGNPVEVAARYGAINRGLAFGRQIISAETFPAYAIGLALVFGVTVVVNVVSALVVDSRHAAP